MPPPRPAVLADFDRDRDESEGSCTPPADALGGAERARPHRRLWRDLVDAAVHRYLRSARVREGCAVDRRAPVRRRGVGSARARRCSGSSRASSCTELMAGDAPDFNGTLIITGFIASRPRGRADHARPQRQRLLRFDLRRAARRRRDPHLDRRRRRAVGRSAPRAGRAGHRLAVVQRGDGAGVLRRQGHPSADHGAGGRPRHSDLDPQHLRAAEAAAR